MQSTAVKSVSRKRTRNVGPGRFIQQYRRIKVWHAGKQYDLYLSQLTCVLLVHITSTHKPGSDAIVVERSNFNDFPTHTQDHGDAKQ